MTVARIDFQSAPPPEHYTLAFEPFLYNQEAYLQLKKGERRSFYAVDHAQPQVLARIHFLLVLDETGTQRAVSLPQSPFGSVECASLLSKLLLYQFLRYVVERLTHQGIQEMTIKHYVSIYQPTVTRTIKHVLKELSFSTNEVLTNSHIVVDEEKIDNKLRAGELGRMKKCQRARFTFQQEPLTSLKRIHGFVEESYASRGRGLSLSREMLEEQAKAIPGCYQFFSVYHQDEIIAATITVRAHPRILYTYSYTALTSYNRYSPTVWLLSRLYRYCYQSNIHTLDLGTSLTDSVQDFKRRIGGTPSLKCIYTKNLADG